MSNLSNKSRVRLAKAVTVLTSVTTMLSMSGVMYLAPTALAVVPADYGLQEGWTISAAGSDDPDVYIVNELGYKRLFLNPVIFNFYGHLGGFAAVHNVSAATRDAFGTSGLFRNCETNDPKVYGLGTTGEDVGMLHWVNTSGAQAVADDPNFFKKVFCINNNEFNWYPKGADYMSVNDVPNYSRQPSVSPTGPISVSLAYDNPAAGSIVDGQARYDLAHFMFSGSGSVTKVKLKRIGISADASITNVYLYDGIKRLTDAATVSDSHITFNDAAGIFSAGRTISVLADINGDSGETIGVQVVEVNGTAVTPVSGNLHTIATATIATLAMNATTTPNDGDNGDDDDDNGDTDPANDVSIWQNIVTVGQRYIWLKTVQFRVVGSVVTSDVQNFRLYVDGVAVGSAVAQADSNGYLVFDMSGSPIKMETGSRTLKVLANIVGGSNKEFYLSLRQKSDIWVTDSQYGAAVLSTGTFPVGDVDNDIEVAQGTLTITKTPDSPSGDVVKDASGVVLARYEVKAAGEKLKIENLRVDFQHGDNGGSTVATNVTELRNGALFANGVQVGSTADINEDSNTTTYTEYSLGSSLIVTPGSPVTLEVRSDIKDGDTTDNMLADDVITARIIAGSSNVQRLVSLNYFSNTLQAGSALTVKTGSLTVSKYTGYANQSVVSPKNGVKMGHWSVTAASSEDVNINTVDITQTTGTGTTFADDLSDAYVKVWNDAGAVIYTSPVKTSLSTTASNSYTTNFTIPKNKTYQVEFWGNLDSGFANTDVLVSAFDVSGVTTGSSTTVNVTRVDGQTITGAAGAFTVANGTVPVARLINGGQTANVYNFTITPTYDDYYLDEVYVDILTPTTASSSGAVANVFLKEGTTTLASAVINATTGSASFTGLNKSLAQAAGTKTFSVDVQFSNVGVGANDTGGNVTLYLDGYKQRNSAGTITTVKGLATATYAANAHYDVKGYPTFTNVALSSTVLAGGTQTLFKTSVSATGGQIAWNDITFTVSSNSAAGNFGAAGDWKLFENGVDISGISGTASVSDVGTTTRVEFDFGTERVISAGNSVTLELKTTVSGTLAANDSVTTKLTEGLGSTVSTDDSVDQAAKATSFVWTDQSQASHATTTDDWFTDGLVKSLAQSQTLTK